jgi:hypothetical protein
MLIRPFLAAAPPPCSWARLRCWAVPGRVLTSPTIAVVERTRAIALLRQRLTEIDGLPTSPSAPEFREWRERTTATLDNTLPAGHRAHNGFSTIRYTPRVATSSSSGLESSAFQSGLSNARAIISAAIYELEEFGDDDGTESSPVLAVHEVRLVEAVVTQFQRADDEGELDALDPDDHAEAAAEVETLNAQLRSPKPKRSIVRAALSSLSAIMQNAVGAAIGVGLVEAVQEATRLIH